jgi:hypothetical protein
VLGMCYIICMNSYSVCYVVLGMLPHNICFPRETCHIVFLIFRVALIFMSIIGRFFEKWFLPMVFYFQLRN